MDTNRLKRYKEKLNLIDKRLEEVSEWKDYLLSEEKSKLATYKAFQEIVEGSMDILAMIIKDKKLIPKDDYLNIDIAKENKLLTKDLCDALRDMNGLRNRIIHEYNGLRDNLALDSIEGLLPQVTKFTELVEKWLVQQNSKS